MNYLELLERAKSVAVIGASQNTQKYGFKVTKKLSDRGFDVFPVNLKEEEIYNLQAYKSILDIPVKIDLVSVVTPPEVSFMILDDIQKSNTKIVWFQPGAFDSKVILKTQGLGLTPINDACILVELDNLLNLKNEK